MLSSTLQELPSLLQGLGHTDAHWVAMPQGEMACHFTARLPDSHLDLASPLPAPVPSSACAATLAASARPDPVPSSTAQARRAAAYVRVALVLVCPWHLSVNAPVGGGAGAGAGPQLLAGAVLRERALKMQRLAVCRMPLQLMGGVGQAERQSRLHAHVERYLAGVAAMPRERSLNRA